MWTVHAARVQFCQSDRCHAYVARGPNDGWLGKHGSLLVLSEIASEHRLSSASQHHAGTVSSPPAIPVHAHVYETFRGLDLADAAERAVPTLASFARCAVLQSARAGYQHTRGFYEDEDVHLETLQRLGAQCLVEADIIRNYTVLPPPANHPHELDSWLHNQSIARNHLNDGRALLTLHKLSALAIGMMKMSEWRQAFAAHSRRHENTDLTQRFVLSLATQREAHPTRYFTYRNEVRKCLTEERDRLLRLYLSTNRVITYYDELVANEFDSFCSAYEHLMNFQHVNVPATITDSRAILRSPVSYQTTFWWSHNSKREGSYRAGDRARIHTMQR